LNTDFLFFSQNRYNQIFNQEKQETNKKLEILLNAKLKEKKNLEKKTKMYFFDNNIVTNTQNIKNKNAVKHNK